MRKSVWRSLLLMAIGFVIASCFGVCMIPFAYTQEPAKQDSLKARMNISDSPDTYKKWLSTPPHERKPVKNVRVYAKSQMAHATFGASGFKLKDDGSANLSVDMEFIGPDGKQVFAEKNYAKYNGKARGPHLTMVFDPAMDIGFDESDPIGTYHLKK